MNASVAIEGLSTACGGLSPGGLLKLEYLPLPYLSPAARILLSQGHAYIGSALGSIYPKGWLTLPFLVTDLNWSDNAVQTDQGRHYERSITATITGHNATIVSELERMGGFRYLLRAIDRDGQGWLLNTPATAFSFTHQFQSGATGSQTRRHSIRFQGQTPKNAATWQW